MKSSVHSAVRVRPLTPATLSQWPFPDHAADTDKEGRGHVLIIAGSDEVPGAALLAAVAALRSGAGKLTVAAPQSVAMGLALAIPEARVIPLAQGKNGAPLLRAVERLAPLASKVNAVVLGPGMLDEKHSLPFVRALLPHFASSTVVLDAVAMAVANDRAFEQPVILTPHAGEMAHLMGWTKEQVLARPAVAAAAGATGWNAWVALKGAQTFVVAPTAQTWRFDGGSVGLATSGSGDTLAGLIGGLAARGMTPLAATNWGIALHARAGARLAQLNGPLGYLARELAAEIPGLICKATAAVKRPSARTGSR